MHSNFVLDSVANILVRHIVFVGNVQKSSIPSHLKFCSSSAVKVQHSKAKRKVDKMSVHISLILKASDIFLSRHIIFSLDRAAGHWAILEIISGCDPSLEMIAPK